MFIQSFLQWLSYVLGPSGVRLTGGVPRKRDNLESGQGLVEYALIIILVGLVVVAMLFVLGPSIANMYQNIIDQFE